MVVCWVVDGYQHLYTGQCAWVYSELDASVNPSHPVILKCPRREDCLFFFHFHYTFYIRMHITQKVPPKVHQSVHSMGPNHKGVINIMGKVGGKRRMHVPRACSQMPQKLATPKDTVYIQWLKQKYG